MTLYRYLLKDIFSHTTAVSLVFLFIVLSSRSIQYLEQVSRGELNADLVFWVIIYRLPEFLQLIIPFAFFISIILVIGKLYSNSEMIILEQNGFSATRFIKVFIFLGTFFALLTGILSLSITPIFNDKLDKVHLETSFEDNFYSIQAGKFHMLENLSVIYAKEKEDNVLHNVFLKLHDEKGHSLNSFITAKKAYLSEGSKDVLILEEGFSFIEEEANLVEISFDALELNFQEDLSRSTLDSSNENLFQTGRLNKADLQWRFSIPLLCLVSSILAFPLSRVKPRQGRFNRILPSILVFMSYLGLLLLVRGWIQQGLWPSFPGLLVIHALFLIIALLLLLRNSKLGWGS